MKYFISYAYIIHGEVGKIGFGRGFFTTKEPIKTEKDLIVLEKQINQRSVIQDASIISYNVA